MTTSSSSSSGSDPRVQATFDAVDWEALASHACSLFQGVTSSHWGEQVAGGYNLVRFLHLKDANNTVVVARVPLRPKDGTITAEQEIAASKRIESEVATMEYVENYTNIPVPHVYDFGVRDKASHVRSPFILMSKVEGVQLSSMWAEMDDDKRRSVLQQVIDILLELWSHRFDNAGALFKRPDGGTGKDAWIVESDTDESELTARHQDRLVSADYRHGADYWLAYANANLQDICQENFGAPSKTFSHSHAWFLRSLVPALFDPSVDVHGCPLTPGDLHSQNILITHVNDQPRISAIIDWENSGPSFATSFAMYPFFIVDHPIWEEDHPLRERNKRDQATFDELIRHAEQGRKPLPGASLSQLISDSYGIYLFQQTIQDHGYYSEMYPRLFSYVFGADEEDVDIADAFSTSYYWALMEHGILKKYQGRFEKERAAWLEARETLGEDVVSVGLKLTEFRDVLSKHVDKLKAGGRALEWWNSSSGASADAVDPITH